MCPGRPAGWVVRVAGHLDDKWAGWLGGWALERHADGTTTLSSDRADQAGLHALLASLRDLNATLLEVARLQAGPT